MHNITYISDADRDRLVILTDQLRSVTTAEEQQALREEIAEIEAKRKPLHECTLEECTELRTTIFRKFDRLNRTGHYSHAQSFKIMLAHIERRQQVIHREMAMAEAKRVAEKKNGDEPPKREKKRKKDSNDKSTSSSGSRGFSSRWTTGIGSLD